MPRWRWIPGLVPRGLVGFLGKAWQPLALTKGQQASKKALRAAGAGGETEAGLVGVGLSSARTVGSAASLVSRAGRRRFLGTLGALLPAPSADHALQPAAGGPLGARWTFCQYYLPSPVLSQGVCPPPQWPPRPGACTAPALEDSSRIRSVSTPPES